MVRLEDISEKGCIEKINAVAKYYTETSEDYSALIKESIDFFNHNYSLEKKEGKNDKIALDNASEATISHMTEIATGMYRKK